MCGVWPVEELGLLSISWRHSLVDGVRGESVFSMTFVSEYGIYPTTLTDHGSMGALTAAEITLATGQWQYQRCSR